MNEGAVQQQLEGLLDKFFSGTSTNDEKFQINKMLEEFSQQKGVLRYCVYFLQNSTNQHVLMYSLTVCENMVTKLWSSLSRAELTELCQFLMRHLIAHHNELPTFIKNKLVQVAVLTVRVNWPHEYPDYFKDIFEAVRNKATTSLGLLFLLTTSEEFINISSDFVSSQRKEELLEQVQLKLPEILEILLGILESVADKQRHCLAPTPPPSPNVSPIKNIGSPHPGSATSSPFGTPPPSLGVVRNRLSAPLLGTPTKPSLVSSPGTVFPPLDPISEEICVLSLKCLAQLFSWMPLSNMITPPILETVFHFASLGCDSATDLTSYSGNLGSLAMDCINELLVKNCVPREFEAFLMKLFEKSFSLLQRLTGENEQAGSCNFSQLDDKFLAKCSDFFYWFVSSHLKRVEFNPQFPVLEFLGLFYKYTFKQPEADSFCVCLDIWAVFLDHLILMSSDSYGRQSPPSGNHYERYKGVLVGMMETVLRKAMLQFNIDELREIDDDAIDDDNETEWQSFLRQCLEFVGKVAELFPNEAFHLLLPLLEQYSQIYYSLGQHITGTGANRRLVIAEGDECENLHAVLKDLTSILQALGRLAEHFIGDRFSSRLSDALMFINKFCYLAKYSTETQLFNVGNPTPEVLDHDFIELHAQILGTLQAYTHWFAQLHLDCLRQDHTHTETTLLPLITTIIDSAIPVISHEVPEKIVLVACQLLLSMATTVRPAFLPSLLSVRELMTRASNRTLSLLPHKAYLMVYHALAYMLVLPWPEVPDSGQHWEERSGQLSALLSGCAAVLGQLAGATHSSQLLHTSKPELKRCLSLLEVIVSAVAHERSKSKAVLFTAISPSIEVSISLFPVLLHQPDILDLLMAFFLSLFSSLRTQVGPVLTERTVQTFMALCTREQLVQALGSDASLEAKVIEKFLLILQLLVQDLGALKGLLPGIISFGLDLIYPIIAEKTSPDIKLALFGLFHEAMLNNWRYFFPNPSPLTMDNDGESQLSTFLKIMECYGQSLLQADMAVFKHNLSSLDSLNTKHKLFTRPHFHSVLYPLLQLLIGVLVQKSHPLLAEEVCLCVYNMAAVDFNFFRSEFVPKYIESREELSQEQKNKLVKSCKMADDLPSFIQNLRQFVSDLRYFIVLNSTLPENSVTLS